MICYSFFFSRRACKFTNRAQFDSFDIKPSSLEAICLGSTVRHFLAEPKNHQSFSNKIAFFRKCQFQMKLSDATGICSLIINFCCKFVHRCPSEMQLLDMFVITYCRKRFICSSMASNAVNRFRNIAFQAQRFYSLQFHKHEIISISAFKA